MRAFIGVTDGDWFEFLSQEKHLDEVNFWQPSGNVAFRALSPGELFLFKLHSPHNYIVGGGFFAHFTLLPVSLAWGAFDRSNGAGSLEEMRRRIEKYRRVGSSLEDYQIGCVLLEQPFFLPRNNWIESPSDWSANIVRGKGYDLARGLGATIYARLRETLSVLTIQPALSEPAAASPRHGSPVTMLPRLGQGSFRVLITDAYQRRCTITGAKVLPVLEAAHIKPYAKGGEHRLDNGVLLRRDFHALLDIGYITVTPELRVEVSKRVKEDWNNGEEYYRYHGQSIRSPGDGYPPPSTEVLQWHSENVYRG